MTKRIIVFFLLAFGISYAVSFFSEAFSISEYLREILPGLGPILAGIFCSKLFGTKKTYSVLGAQPLKTILIFSIPLITFFISFSPNDLWKTSLFLITQVAYCFGEEWGWRGYLQNETSALNKWIQAFLIGSIWFFWHFSFLDEPIKGMMGDDFNGPLYLGSLMALFFLSLFSIFLGWAVQRTGAILIPTVIHFATKANGITLVITLLIVFTALFTWEKFKVDKKTSYSES